MHSSLNLHHIIYKQALICVYFRHMEWTKSMTFIYVREIIVVEPFQFKKGTVARGQLWTKIAESLNSCKELKFRIGLRSVRERFTEIQKEYLLKNSTDGCSSGTSNDITDLDLLLEEIKRKRRQQRIIEIMIRTKRK